jgi:hypothetical protein
MHIVSPEFRMAAYLTPQRVTVNLDGRDLLVTEDTLLTAE